MLLARFIAPDRTIQVLLPMIESEQYPVNLAAVKMLTQLIENSSGDAIGDFLPEMIPVLLKVFGFHHCVGAINHSFLWCFDTVADRGRVSSAFKSCTSNHCHQN